ncbi:MAG: Gfo/Idh/MocA family oxidoreductase [Pirellulales bacterium]|nr:Gfo/Idh/MocA family oxidoreductase [Pirellulales bacterium]
MSQLTINLSRLRVAVVGLGSIGNRHLNNLHQLGVEQRSVVRRSTQTNPAFATPPDAEVCSSAEGAIAHGIDVAIICTPSSLHFPSAAPFIEAGIPVLIEKPLESTPRAANRLVDLARQQGSYAAVAYCMRYHPAYRAAYEFICSGKLGEVSSAQAHFHTYLPDWHPYEDFRKSYAARADLGGGVIPTLDHEIDFLLWTLGPGRLIDARLTSGQESLQIDVPVAANLTVEHESGLHSQISLDFSNRDFSRGFRFCGTTGELRFDMDEGVLSFAVAECADQSDQPEKLAVATADDLNAMYLAMLRQTLTEIATGTTPSTPLVAGVQSLEICDQAVRLNVKHEPNEIPVAGSRIGEV